MILVSDIFDPRYGSEFIVASKAIDALLRISPHETLELWTLERAGNRKAIKYWLEEKGWSERVYLHLVPMRFGNPEGAHKTKAHFVGDLIRLHIRAYRASTPALSLWKSGQVNLLFNIGQLFFNRYSIIGPVSGFEYPPLRAIAQYGPKALLVKYSIYALLICIMQLLYRLGLKLRQGKLVLLCATAQDYNFLQKAKAGSSHIQVYHAREVDIKAILQHVSKPKIHVNSAPQKKILWAGALIHRKNPLLAAKILSAACARDDALHADMVGNGALYEKVEAEVARLAQVHGHNRVRLLRNRPRAEFVQTLQDYNAVLVTSWREANSVFVLEALAAGCACVSSNISGMKDTVAHTGTLLEFEELNTLETAAQALYEAAQRDKSEAPRAYLEARVKEEEEDFAHMFRFLKGEI